MWLYYQHETDVAAEKGREAAGAAEGRSPENLDDGESVSSMAVGATAYSADSKTSDQFSSLTQSKGFGLGGKSTSTATAVARVMAGRRAHGEQQKLIDRVGALLGLKDKVNATANEQTGKVELNKIVTATHKAIKQDLVHGVDWVCPFSKDELMKVWKAPKHQLKTEDEKTALKLMLKYNGTYSAFVEATNARSKRKQNEVKAGSHVKWDHAEMIVETDVDARARSVLRTLDQAMVNKNPYMDSSLLHGLKQRFPTTVLRVQLEEELDNILREQVVERERAYLRRVDHSDSEDEEQVHEKEGDAADTKSSSEDETGELGKEGEVDDIAMKIKKRAMRRARRRRRLKAEDLEAQVLKVRKLVSTKNKSGEALEMAELQNKLGAMGCLACRTNPCSWKSSIDEPSLLARKKQIDAELDRVRADPEATTFESTVALGAQQGGNTKYFRADLISELMYEKTEIQRRIDLNNVDKELHDSFATRKEYMEVKYLHGYSTILWTNNARRALAARQRHLVAINVAQEVVDDILDWMLEGWYFGERESSYTAVGYVPSIKKDGLIRPGQDQVSTLGMVTAKMKKKVENSKKGVIDLDALPGTHIDKSLPIEDSSQKRIVNEKVAREGTKHWHLLNETESTIRIGLFMITIMYFRAMAFLSREKRSWGEDDIGSSSGSTQRRNVTDERRRMNEEQQRVEMRQKKLNQVLGRAIIGENRRREREQEEKREAAMKLQAAVRRQRLEKEATTTLQRVYRGHLGRKTAVRWALKRAELEAMNSLLNAAAIAIQRVYRGYLGRLDARETRIEMAHFIALMRAQEATADEMVYWDTHPLSKYNRNLKSAVKKTLRLRDRTVPLGGPPIPEEEPDDVDSDEEYN